MIFATLDSVMNTTTRTDGWEDEIEKGSERLAESNLQAANPEAASAAEFQAAVNSVKEKARDCHRLMERRVIFSNEKEVVFLNHTTEQRFAQIAETEQNILLLENKLDGNKANKSEIEVKIRAEELILINLILEQSYADLTYLMTQREVVTKLGNEMLSVAKSGNITKDQVNNLLTEAKALQELYVNLGISSAEAKKLIGYFSLEFGPDAVPILTKLTQEAEIQAEMKIDTEFADRMDFPAKFEFWLNQLVAFNLHDKIDDLTVIRDQMPDLVSLESPGPTATVTQLPEVNSEPTLTNPLPEADQTGITDFGVLPVAETTTDMANTQPDLTSGKIETTNAEVKPENLSRRINFALRKILQGISGQVPELEKPSEDTSPVIETRSPALVAA